MYNNDSYAEEYKTSLRSARRRYELEETTVWECVGDQIFAYWCLIDRYIDDIIGVQISLNPSARIENRKKAEEAVEYAKKRWGRCSQEQLEASLKGFIGNHTPEAAFVMARKAARGIVENL